MPKPYTVVQGDCIDSIAFKERVPATLIWNDGANAALKKQREDRNVLLPGDVVTIPDKRPDAIGASATGLTHTFRLKDPSIEYRIEVVLGGEPVADAAVEVRIDGAVVAVTTANGASTCRIPPDAKKAVIRIADRNPAADDDAAEFTVTLGHLDPLSEDSGKRQRLKNIGYLNADVTEVNDAMRLFQPVHSIAPPDPTPDLRTKVELPVLDVEASLPTLKTLMGDRTA